VWGRFFLAVIVLAVIAGAAAILLSMRNGISAHAEPTVAETLIARSVRHLAVPFAARKLRNPVAITAASLREGRDHFADHCASCHANDGSGKTEMGPNFYPKVPDMRLPETQNLSDGELFYIIRNGVRLTGMPAWGEGHDPADDWKLVQFIRHLPKITPAELEDMRRLNPKTPEERDEEKFLEGH
jgi:mono/diheme cytochrome c family protein